MSPSRLSLTLILTFAGCLPTVENHPDDPPAQDVTSTTSLGMSSTTGSSSSTTYGECQSGGDNNCGMGPTEVNEGSTTLLYTTTGACWTGDCCETGLCDPTMTDTDNAGPLGLSCACEVNAPCETVLCGPISLSSDLDVVTAASEQDELNLQCALEAVRDGVAGSFHYTLNTDIIESESVTVTLFGDGTARTSTNWIADLCWSDGEDILAGELPPPDIIDHCLNGGLTEQLLCLETLLDAAGPLLTCEVAGQVCKGDFMAR